MRRITLHIRPQDKEILDRYIDVWKRTGIHFKRMNIDGQGEFYRRVIMNRLQNITYDDIAEYHGVSRERCRQIYARFDRYCRKHNHSLERELYRTIKIRRDDEPISK